VHVPHLGRVNYDDLVDPANVHVLAVDRDAIELEAAHADSVVLVKLLRRGEPLGQFGRWRQRRGGADLEEVEAVVAAVLVGERQGVSHRVVEDEHPSDTAVDTREPLSFCETSNGVRSHPCMSGTDDDRAPAREVAHV
jgi:hypothetical protein